MSDEDAFLAALTANPADDVCRLAYADWLEEREHLDKANYLRLVCRAKEVLDTPDEEEVSRQILRLCDFTPFEWRELVASRFDLVLVDYPSGWKIALIKLLRQLFGWGIAKIAGEVEFLPNRFLTNLPLEDVVSTRDMLRDIPHITIRVEASPVDTTSAVERLGKRFELHTGFSWGFNHPRLDDEMRAGLEQALLGFVRIYGSNYPARVSRRDWGLYAVVAEDVPLQVVTRLLRTLEREGREIGKRFEVQFSISSHPTENS